MCLLTTQSKALRAKEDIIVYKLFVNDNGRLGSPYRHFYYPKLGRQKTVSLGVEKNTIGFPFFDRDATLAYIDKKSGQKINTISQGYHSCLRKSTLSQFSYGKVLYKCIIPKGAWYYKGYCGLMVSTDLIIGEKC